MLSRVRSDRAKFFCDLNHCSGARRSGLGRRVTRRPIPLFQRPPGRRRRARYGGPQAACRWGSAISERSPPGISAVTKTPVVTAIAPARIGIRGSASFTAAAGIAVRRRASFTATVAVAFVVIVTVAAILGHGIGKADAHEIRGDTKIGGNNGKTQANSDHLCNSAGPLPKGRTPMPTGPINGGAHCFTSSVPLRGKTSTVSGTPFVGAREIQVEVLPQSSLTDLYLQII